MLYTILENKFLNEIIYVILRNATIYSSWDKFLNSLYWEYTALQKEFGGCPILFFTPHTPTSLLKADDREMEEGGVSKEQGIWIGIKGAGRRDVPYSFHREEFLNSLKW